MANTKAKTNKAKVEPKVDVIKKALDAVEEVKTKTNKAKVEPKVDVIKKALDAVQDAKTKAQAEYDSAVAALVVVRN